MIRLPRPRAISVWLPLAQTNTFASTNKCLAQSNKSRAEAPATNQTKLQRGGQTMFFQYLTTLRQVFRKKSDNIRRLLTWPYADRLAAVFRQIDRTRRDDSLAQRLASISNRHWSSTRRLRA
jgi:hypothetical protein